MFFSKQVKGFIDSPGPELEAPPCILKIEHTFSKYLPAAVTR